MSTNTIIGSISFCTSRRVIRESELIEADLVPTTVFSCVTTGDAMRLRASSEISFRSATISERTDPMSEMPELFPPERFDIIAADFIPSMLISSGASPLSTEAVKPSGIIMREEISFSLRIAE